MKLVPAEKQADDIFGYMAGKKIVGDIVGPVTPLEDWKISDPARHSYPVVDGE